MRRKRRKRRSKIKFFILMIFITAAIIGALYVYKLTSSYFDSKDKVLYVNNNLFSFDCPEDYKYIHLELSTSNDNSVRYNIINPKGQVVKSDMLSGNTDFFCNSEKGIWKVSFDLNKDINVSYKLWEGSLKFRDPLMD